MSTSTTRRQLEALGFEWDYELTHDSDLEFVELSGDRDEKAWGETGEIKIPGLRECLGIAVYDHSSENVYAGHFVTMGESREDFMFKLQGFDSALRAHDIDYENSEAMVAGINYDSDTSRHFFDDPIELDQIASGGEKQALTEKYLENFFSEYTARWDIEDNYTGEITIDIDEGNLEYSGRAMARR